MKHANAKAVVLSRTNTRQYSVLAPKWPIRIRQCKRSIIVRQKISDIINNFALNVIHES